MKKALIIFARNPILGKVKTRIAETTGDAKALEIYYRLLAHTRAETCHLNCDKFVYYDSFIDEDDGWDNACYQKRLQHGTDLGKRMKAAFNEVFSAAYLHVAIIGTDCMQINSSIIDSGFDKMHKNDAVIGPSLDGGYYLLGIKKMLPALFENKQWSSSTVCHDTIADLKATGLTYSELPMLRDIDVEADLHSINSTSQSN